MPPIQLWQAATGLGVGAFIAALFYAFTRQFGRSEGQGFQTTRMGEATTAVIAVLLILIFGAITILALVLYAPNVVKTAGDGAHPTPNAAVERRKAYESLLASITKGYTLAVGPPPDVPSMTAAIYNLRNYPEYAGETRLYIENLKRDPRLNPSVFPQQFAAIDDAATGTLKAVDVVVVSESTPAFEVFSHTAVFDLSHWQTIGEGQKNSKVSPVTTETDLSLRRLRNDVVVYTHRIASTSPLAPDCTSPTHSLTMTSVPGNAFTENMRAWWLNFDIRGEPVYQTFDLRFLVTAWNSFQGMTTEWAAASVIQPTRKLELIVHFPTSKPCKQFQLFEYPRIERTKREHFSGVQNTVLSKDGREFTWRVDSPRLDYIYRVDWDW